MLLYVQRDLRLQCCFTSTETVRTIKDGKPRTATSSFTQLLRSVIKIDGVLAVYCPVNCRSCQSEAKYKCPNQSQLRRNLAQNDTTPAFTHARALGVTLFPKHVHQLHGVTHRPRRHTHTLTTLSLSLSLTTHTHCPTLSLSLSLSHTHTLIHIHTRARAHALSLSLSLSTTLVHALLALKKIFLSLFFIVPDSVSNNCGLKAEGNRLHVPYVSWPNSAVNGTPLPCLFKCQLCKAGYSPRSCH